MTKYCHCDPSIKNLRVYYNYDEDLDMLEPEQAFNQEGKLWTDPQWKVIPSHLCSFLAHFTQLVPWKDMRQCFLFEDLLNHYDDGALCGASMFLDREPECSCLLQDLHHVETSIPVPLKHILPQKFTTQLLVQTLRKIDQLPRSTEASVRESTDQRIIELIPGLQDIRKKTLPQMYLEDCSVFRETYGRVNPLFQHPEDAVLLIWKPGNYDHVYFMFVSQLYPHHKQFKIQEWSMIVFSHEMTGAIKKRVDSPAQGNTPQDGDDPIHPDQHGDVPPNDDDEMLSGDEPEDPLDDDHQPLMIIINLITRLDMIQTMKMIKNTSFQMIMDHHLMMIWICQEYRTRGKQIYQVYHQLRFTILTFPSKRLLIMNKMTILHQDLIRRQSLSGFKGNRDRFQLILLMLYQRPRQR